MRRLSASLCLLLLLLTLGGRALFFELRLAEIRADMRRQIAGGGSSTHTRKLVFTEAEWSALQGSDEGEFDWNGARYDVVSQRQERGKIVVQAISDKEETALVATFQKAQKGPQAPASLQLLKLAALAYIVPTGHTLPGPGIETPSEHNGRCRQLTPQTYPEHHGPPPREWMQLS